VHLLLNTPGVISFILSFCQLIAIKISSHTSLIILQNHIDLVKPFQNYDTVYLQIMEDISQNDQIGLLSHYLNLNMYITIWNN